MEYTFTIDNTKWSMYRLEQAEYCAGSPEEIELIHSYRDFEKEKEEILARQKAYKLKIEKDKSRRIKRQDEYDFGEVIIEKDSIFSTFRTDRDEIEQASPEPLWIIE